MEKARGNRSVYLGRQAFNNTEAMKVKKEWSGNREPKYRRKKTVGR